MDYNQFLNVVDFIIMDANYISSGPESLDGYGSIFILAILKI